MWGVLSRRFHSEMDKNIIGQKIHAAGSGFSLSTCIYLISSNPHYSIHLIHIAKLTMDLDL